MKDEHGPTNSGNEEVNIHIIVEIADIDRPRLDFHKHEVTGLEIKEAAHLSPDVELEVMRDGILYRVNNHESVTIKDGERFYVVNNETQIDYTVDDEPQSTTHRVLTPVKIMEEAKPQPIDPKTHYLIRIIGHERESFKDAPEKHIRMHNHMKFIANFMAQCLFLIGNSAMGRDIFKEGLEALGYTAELKDTDKIVFSFVIPEGRFANRSVKVGIQVPPDYEMTPPSGIHISPRLIPISPRAPDHKRADNSAFGGDWQYLSRPIPEWPRKRTVKRYMEWVSYLLNTL